MPRRADMRTGVVIQARMSSARLPGKVLRTVAGRPLLGHLLERLGQAVHVDEVVLATSDRPDDDAIAHFGSTHGVRVHRGPLDDVLGRFTGAAAAARLDAVVRVCADSPLLDPGLVDDAVIALGGGTWDAVSNVVRRTYPPGQSVEAMTADTLTRLDRMSVGPEREHVTTALYRETGLFRVLSMARIPAQVTPHLAVDTAADLARIEAIMDRMARPHWSYGLDEVLGLADAA